MREGLNLLLEALRYHKKKPAGFAVLADRLSCCMCTSSFSSMVKKQDENAKVQVSCRSDRLRRLLALRARLRRPHSLILLTDCYRTRLWGPLDASRRHSTKRRSRRTSTGCERC